MEIYNLKSEGLTKKHKCDNIDTDAGSAANSFLVTAIKPAVRNENRVNVFINDRYEFSLDLAQVVDFKLKVGQTITPEQLTEYKHASEFGKLYQRTLEWVLTRPHSIQETRDYLKRKRLKRETENRQAIRNRERLKSETEAERTERKAREEKFGSRLRTKELPLFSDDDIEKIIARLTEKNYLNDYEFAKYFLENRNAKKGTSLKKLKLELTKKGIDRVTVEEILAETPRDDATEIQKIIAKKREKYDDEKLTQYLLRQGFPFELIRQAVSETDSQNPA